MNTSDTTTTSRQLRRERLLAVNAFLAVGLCLTLALGKSWNAYTEHVAPAQQRLIAYDAAVAQEAERLVQAYRLPASPKIAGAAMLRATREIGDAPVATALEHIKDANASKPLPPGFSASARRLIHTYRLQRQFYKQQLMEGFSHYEAQAPLLGRLVNYVYIIIKMQ